MADISESNFAKLILDPDDVYRVITQGVATVTVLYGAPSGTTTVTASSQTFGPYGANVSLRVTATSGQCTYTKIEGRNLQAIGDVVQPDDAQSIARRPDGLTNNGQPFADIAALQAVYPAASNPGATSFVGASWGVAKQVLVIGGAWATAINYDQTGLITDAPARSAVAGAVRSAGVGSRTEVDSNPFYTNPFVSQPIATNPETITTTLGPSVASGGTITAEYNALKSGKTEIAFRTDADRTANGALLADLSFASAFVSGVSTFASDLSALPVIGAGGVSSWNSDGGVHLVLDGDWIAFVYGDNTTSNSAEVYVDGKQISGATNGVISNSIASSNHSPQWIVLSFADRRRRTVTLVKARLQGIILKKDAQIYPAQKPGRAMVFGDSNALRSLTTGESSKIVRKNVAADALECLGYSVVNAAIGGTGFVNDGGGLSAGKANYPTVIDFYLALSGFNANSINLVWLFGTGNDIGHATTSQQYEAVIQKALTSFPNATVLVTGVYEGFNTTASAASQNVILRAGIALVNSPRVKFVGTDRANNTRGQAMWFGTGSVNTTTGDGNADLYLGSASSGVDRHANAAGCAHAANWLANEFVLSGLPFIRR